MKRKKKILAAGLAGVLCMALAFPVSATKSGLEDAKKKKTTLEEEKKKVEAALNNLEGLKSDTAAYVRKLDENLAAIADELEILAADIAVSEEKIAAAKEELLKAQETEERQYESMKLRIQYMYEKGDSSYVDLLMTAGSFPELLNKAEYIAKISSYDREQLDEYAATKEAIVVKELELETEREELLALQEQTKIKQASAEQLMTAKQSELKNYENQIAAAEGQLSEYEADLKAQEDAIKSIEEEIKRQEEEARKKAEEAGKSYKTVNLGDINFIWPLPASKRITSRFGDREAPVEGASTIHKGIDVGASSGSDIIAAASGTVVVSTYSYSAGNYLMINHGGGVYTVYMHCSKLLVSVGDQVQQGQSIAKTGSTGYSTGPHLHFGIRVNGTYVNPLQYVSP